MTAENIARQTYRWLVSTGRIGGEAEAKVNAIGFDTFIAQAAQEWEAAGALDFMQGMKSVMNSIIWSTNE